MGLWAEAYYRGRMDGIKPPLICSKCQKPKPPNDHHHTYLGSKCSDCYSKYKHAKNIRNGKGMSKGGNWFCSCGRVHPNKHNYCWDCGLKKSLDLADQVLKNISIKQ